MRLLEAQARAIAARDCADPAFTAEMRRFREKLWEELSGEGAP